MSKGLVSKSSIIINAPAEKVWQAFTKPQIIKQYMFGTDVETDWSVGNPIFWRGQWEGKRYEDKGTVLAVQKHRLLQYTHFSPLAGQVDTPENYHTITIELSSRNGGTAIVFLQNGNDTKAVQEHSKKNWDMMLQSLKQLLEK